VLSYGGSTIFAEFSASNGGLTSGDGVHPYFVTKADPYDNAASGDPYLSWTDTAAASDVASYYGLARVTQLQITAREGGGTWGGFVATGTVVGLNANGSAASIPVTGDGLRSALGLKSKYFHIRPVLPLGNLESTTKTALHSVKLTGWTFDPAHTDQANSILVVAGSSRYSFAANLPRPDVQQVYGTASPNHGFNATVPVPGGSTKLCIWGISIDAKDSIFLGCRTVTVPVSPIGNLETVVANGTGQFRVAGWEFDPDNNGGPGRVHVYVDGAGFAFTAANSRPDVRAYYGLANDQVGFDVTVPVPVGKHTICAYGINVTGTPGANVTLRCVAVTR
jgi:hypothetical protein